MARNFKTDWDAVTIAAPKTLAALENTATPVKAEIYEIAWGSPASPSTAAGTYAAGRTTANGTGGTTPTAVLMDPDAAPANTMTVRLPAVEPTYGATVLGPLPLNQQATFRWVTQPGQGTGLYSAHAGSSSGMGFKSIAIGGSAFTSSGHIMWQE